MLKDEIYNKFLKQRIKAFSCLQYNSAYSEYRGRKDGKNLFSAFFIHNDSGISQNEQMLTHGGKLYAYRIHKLADTVFRIIRQLLDNPKPDGMSKSFEYLRFVLAAFLSYLSIISPRYSAI